MPPGMQDPWLAHYDKGVPATIASYPDKTLVDFVREHARRRPRAVAVTFKTTRLTFAQLDGLSDALAVALAGLGLKKGDRLGLVLPNAPQFLIAELAAWKLGAIVAPQNPLYTARELEDSFAASRPDIVVTLTAFYERVKQAQAKGGYRLVVATSIKEYLPPLLRLLFTLLKERREGHRVTLRPGDAWLQPLIHQGESATAPSPAAAPSDPAVILMSGGTTGTPKGVVSDHRGLVQSGTQLLAWLREPLAGKNPSIMLPLPLFHTYGCAGAQPMTVIAGIPLQLVPNPRDVSDLLKTIERERPAILCGVPTLFSAILNHPRVAAGRVDLSSISGCFSGAAALMAETKRRFEALTGGRIVEGYSLTEATMACCVNPFGGVNKPGSIGVPICDVRAKVVDAERGKGELPAGEIGEILIGAPQLMKGYWGNPAETALVLEPAADGPWLHTGDLGYMDEDGYLFVVDRKKDLIKASGFQVWPREIEEVIAGHPGVAEVGVAGVPDERKGEAIQAWVVLRAGATVSEDELRAFCREKLAPFKVPRRIRFVPDLPKTMVGKVLRRVLVEQALGEMRA
ncbi:MAG TPA: AMP-binding protein [Vicinamibacteria bacterium]|nr:AMP-binding protein [Vicinamibacteria bacterium]